MRIRFLVILFFLASIMGCETPQSSTAESEPKSTASTPGVDLDFEDTIAVVQRLRDREFQKRPTLRGVASFPPQAVESTSTQSVGRDRDTILESLFGVESRAEHEAFQPLEALARYEAASHQITFVTTTDDAIALELAIVVALVEALDTEHFGELRAPTSWDEALAMAANRRASAIFVAARYFAQRSDQNLAPAVLAEQPELALRVERLSQLFEARPDPGEDGPQAGPTAQNMAPNVAQSVARAAAAFEIREGFTLATAMYRANQWSGVELLRLNPPESTAYVVRPDRWMRGEDLGDWSWPEELEQTRRAADWQQALEGRVGPAIAALWLSRFIDPRQARTIYNGWMSDAYRSYHRPSESGSGAVAFEWVSQWDTPHSAQQIAQAFELALGRQFPGANDDEPGKRRFVVVHRGVQVSVIIASRAEDRASLENGARLLVDATVAYLPGEGMPVSFVPTRHERFIQTAALAALVDGERWSDPGLGFEMNLKPLEDWNIQKTDEITIRWFARHQDGALIQLTTELADPTGHEFGSDVYLKELRQAFEASLGKGNVEPVERREHDTLGKVLLLSGVGSVEGSPRGLHAWQFMADDVVITYSLQAPPGTFDTHLLTARKILDTAALAPSSNLDPEPTGDGGIIEFHVED